MGRQILICAEGKESYLTCEYGCEMNNGTGTCTHEDLNKSNNPSLENIIPSLIIGVCII